jgi:CheY-like chemotaxis protein
MAATAKDALELEDLSVLLVEEDAEFRGFTAEMLHTLGLRDVVLAGAESDAIAELERRSFDALLCSHRLGVGGGVLKSARRASPSTRAILMTAYAPASKVLARALADADVLEKPFSLPMLELVLRRVASRAHGLRGDVQELSLVDLLQMYHHGRQSIAVVLSGPVAGRVRLSKGEIVQVESGSLRGLPALSRLLGASTGTISTELAPADASGNIQGSFQSIVLKAIAKHDEQRRSTPPGASMHDLDATTSNLAARRAPIPPSLMRPLPGLEPDADATRRRAGGSLRFRDWSAALRPERRWLLLVPSLALLCLGAYLWLSPAGSSDDGNQSADPGADGSAPTASAQAHLEAARASAAAGSETRAHSFRLAIDSEPAPANVTENGAVLGKTPLLLDIERRSVANAKRRFVLTRDGYLPYVLDQGDSRSALRVVAELVPLPTVPQPSGAPRLALPRRPAGSTPPPAAAASPTRDDGTSLDIRLQR